MAGEHFFRGLEFDAENLAVKLWLLKLAEQASVFFPKTKALNEGLCDCSAQLALMCRVARLWLDGRRTDTLAVEALVKSVESARMEWEWTYQYGPQLIRLSLDNKKMWERSSHKFSDCVINNVATACHRRAFFEERAAYGWPKKGETYCREAAAELRTILQ